LVVINCGLAVGGMSLSDDAMLTTYRRLAWGWVAVYHIIVPSSLLATIYYTRHSWWR
jgi:hypothetical protein